MNKKLFLIITTALIVSVLPINAVSAKSMTLQYNMLSFTNDIFIFIKSGGPPIQSIEINVTGGDSIPTTLYIHTTEPWAPVSTSYGVVYTAPTRGDLLKGKDYIMFAIEPLNPVLPLTISWAAYNHRGRLIFEGVYVYSSS